ncbi:MAG: hypothetical protein JJT78_14395 [Leptospira sp.]|nr:hypothetical protein [Leptospira sp.]
MEFILQNPSIENSAIEAKIREIFPDFKIKVPPLNKKITVIQKDSWIMCRVIRKKEKLIIKGEPNTTSPAGMGLIIAGVLAGLIGAVVVIGLMYAINGSKASAFAKEVQDKIQGNL